MDSIRDTEADTSFTSTIERDAEAVDSLHTQTIQKLRQLVGQASFRDSVSSNHQANNRQNSNHADGTQTQLSEASLKSLSDNPNTSMELAEHARRTTQIHDNLGEQALLTNYSSNIETNSQIHDGGMDPEASVVVVKHTNTTPADNTTPPKDDTTQVDATAPQITAPQITTPQITPPQTTAPTTTTTAPTPPTTTTDLAQSMTELAPGVGTPPLSKAKSQTTPPTNNATPPQTRHVSIADTTFIAGNQTNNRVAADNNNTNTNNNNTTTTAPKPKTYRQQISSLWKPFGSKVTMSKANVSATTALSVLVASWNVGNAVPDAKEYAHWLPVEDSPDIVVVGAQECNYTINKTERASWRESRKILRESMVSMQMHALDVQGAQQQQQQQQQQLAQQSQQKQSQQKQSQQQQQPSQQKQKRKAQKKGFFARFMRHGDRKLVSKDHFNTQIQIVFGPQYRQVAAVQLKEMRLIVLCKMNLLPHISGVQKQFKATGFGGVVGNKGGLMVKLTVHNTQLCFLSCHLAAHESERKVAHRNHDVYEILKSASVSGSSYSSHTPVDLAQSHDHVFVLGDLNYRINLSIGDGLEREDRTHWGDVVALVESREFDELYQADQLKREMAQKNVLVGFSESAPTFEPTFKVLRGCELQYNQQRTPSYCDRILWSSFPGLRRNISQTYMHSANSVTTSDHKPVFSMFKIDCVNPDATNKEVNRRSFSMRFSRKSTKGEALLQLQITRLKVRGICCQEFVSATSIPMIAFDGPAVLIPQSAMDLEPNSQPGAQTIKWAQVPAIPLRSTKASTLEYQHVIISLRDKSVGTKLLGQAVLNLKAWTHSVGPIKFDLELLRYGVPCGLLRGFGELVTVTHTEKLPRKHGVSSPLAKQRHIQ